MRFGPVPLALAEGAILAHSVTLAGGRLRKGKVLTRDDVAALSAAGMTSVIVARLDGGDVHEDAAALRLAQALVPDPGAAGLRLVPVGTGRVNVMADGPGVMQIDARAVHAVNAVDPMMTVATVPEWQRIDAGGMVATVKIIAYAVPGAALERACAAAADTEAAAALILRRPVVRQAVLIQTVVAGAGDTENSGGSDETGGKGHRVTAARLDRLGVALADPASAAHRVVDLAGALRRALGQGAELVLILTGSATSDPRDVAPEAVRAAGGEVSHFGMPVDPGNLLFFGHIGVVPVIGLPGCAKSPALNGADWVLERIACGVAVSSADIMAMGVGGLLKEIPSRPQPREKPRAQG